MEIIKIIMCIKNTTKAPSKLLTKKVTPLMVFFNSTIVHQGPTICRFHVAFKFKSMNSQMGPGFTLSQMSKSSKMSAIGLYDVNSVVTPFSQSGYHS